MMIAYAVLGLGVFILLVLAVRTIPRLRVIDVDSIQKEKLKAMKEQIIFQKLTRKSSGAVGKVVKGSEAVVRIASRHGRRAIQRLYALEQYYQKLTRLAEEGHHAYEKERIRKLADEANELVKQDEFIPAEKIYIDIISHNPKSIEAYEGLGNLYRKNKQFEQARETLSFSLKLSPNDASVLAALGELELELGHEKKSLEHLQKAIKKRPKNPKYLDFYIEAALRAGSLKDTNEGMKKLKEVNPENKKLEEFAERFSKVKEKYVAKTTETSEQKNIVE